MMVSPTPSVTRSRKSDMLACLLSKSSICSRRNGTTPRHKQPRPRVRLHQSRRLVAATSQLVSVEGIWNLRIPIRSEPPAGHPTSGRNSRRRLPPAPLKKGNTSKTLWIRSLSCKFRSTCSREVRRAIAMPKPHLRSARRSLRGRKITIVSSAFPIDSSNRAP